MPYKPKVPCKHAGCPNLVQNGTNFCDKHKKDRPAEVRNTVSRGYDGKWRKASKAFLNAHPLCENCKADGRLTKAEVVDHIKPHRGDRRLFWDRDNWQALCKRCHDKKTATEERFVEYKY